MIRTTIKINDGMAAILVMWPKQFVYIWLSYHKESTYEILVQLAWWIREDYVLIYLLDSNMSDLG